MINMKTTQALERDKNNKYARNIELRENLLY